MTTETSRHGDAAAPDSGTRFARYAVSVVFFLTASNFITGQILSVSGGLTMVLARARAPPAPCGQLGAPDLGLPGYISVVARSPCSTNT